MITQELLKEWLTYNPETGIFKWIPRPKSHREKYEAGHKMLNGYITISLKGKQYMAHRLAFLYMTGALPIKNVDHINRIRDDNRWTNLRQASHSENSGNRSSYRKLPVGVYEITRKGRPGIWYAGIIVSKGKKFSVTRRNKEEVILWRKMKEKELFGEFAPNV